MQMVLPALNYYLIEMSYICFVQQRTVYSNRFAASFRAYKFLIEFICFSDAQLILNNVRDKISRICVPHLQHKIRLK